MVFNLYMYSGLFKSRSNQDLTQQEQDEMKMLDFGFLGMLLE